jgi:hypothetical protein
VSVTQNPTNNFPDLPPVTAAEEIRDICRESQLTPGEAHDEYRKLNGQITAHLDAFVGKIVDATECNLSGFNYCISRFMRLQVVAAAEPG